MKRLITLLLCMSFSVSIIAQDIVGTWQTEVTDSSTGIKIGTQIIFNPDGSLQFIRVFYNNDDAAFTFLAFGKYNYADNYLFMDFQSSVAGYIVDNQLVSPTNNWQQLVGNGIDVNEIGSASAGYTKTLPREVQVVQLTNDSLETSEWKLIRSKDE